MPALSQKMEEMYHPDTSKVTKMVVTHDLISDQKKCDYMLFISAHPREAMMLL
jgi:hypothetical protein